MDKNKEHIELAWSSLILRVAFASLFFVAAAAKFMGGYNQSVAYIIVAVKESFLPVWLVSIYAHILPFAEAAIAIWLLVGFKLREAWIFTAFVLITLSFGLAASKQNGADVFMYMVFACAGLILSRYDCGCPCKKNK